MRPAINEWQPKKRLASLHQQQARQIKELLEAQQVRALYATQKSHRKVPLTRNQQMAFAGLVRNFGGIHA